MSHARRQWEALGQGHVFQFWDELFADEQHDLLESLRSIGDPELLRSAISEAFAGQSKETEGKQVEDEITPFDRIVLKSEAPEETRQGWLRGGLESVSRGEVAVVTLAGGQGTRLGSSEPKGCFDVGLPSKRPLFQIQADRLTALRDLAAEITGIQGIPSIPWYIMTSDATDDRTRAFFLENEYFGLSDGQVRFLKQGVMPAVDQDGKVFLETKSTVALSPDGNGGVYAALAKSGALEHMKSLGVKWVHTVGVDNVLVRPADPVLVGFGASQVNSRIVNKVVRKRDPEEQVGVMCYRNGLPGVVEYSEISPEMSRSRIPGTEDLQFGAANIAEHLFRLSFLQEICGAEKLPLPWHCAVKVIPHVDLDSGEEVRPTSPNGVKLERFIFDVFHLDPNMSALVVEREEEFSPVKNAEGGASPITARNDLSRLHRSWVKDLFPDLKFREDSGSEGLLEICPRVAYSAETPQEQRRIRAVVGEETQLTLPLFLQDRE